MKLVERVARALMRHYEVDPDVFIGMHGDRGHFDEAALAAIHASVERLEPVAWRYDNPEFKSRTGLERLSQADFDNDWTETPLYDLSAIMESLGHD